MLLGFVLGPMMEEYFRRALLISRGEFAVFIERPISAVLLCIALALLLSLALPALGRLRQRAVEEQQSL
jgi:putative tricarboxylic transport membrane protein